MPVPRHQVPVSRRACGGRERAGKSALRPGEAPALSPWGIAPGKAVGRMAFAEKHSKQNQARITQSLGLVTWVTRLVGKSSQAWLEVTRVWLMGPFCPGQPYTERKKETLLICWERALSSGYHLALVLSTHGGRLAAKQPWNPAAAWLLWEKSPSHPRVHHLPEVPAGPFPSLESPPASPFWGMCWIFPSCDTCRLWEVHVIYVWKWSRWTWLLILHWSHALNFNFCSATDLLFYLEQTTTAPCTSAHPSVQTSLAMWPPLADPHCMGWLRSCINMWLDTRTLSDWNNNYLVAPNKHKSFLQWTVESIKYIWKTIYSTNAAKPSGTKIQIIGISVLGVWWILGSRVLLGADWDQAIEPGPWVSR